MKRVLVVSLLCLVVLVITSGALAPAIPSVFSKKMILRLAPFRGALTGSAWPPALDETVRIWDADYGKETTANDLFGTFDGARYTAEHILGARLIAYPSGGHLWVGHQEDVVSAIVAFLK